MGGPAVGRVNRLTARWAEALEDGRNTVLTAAAVWPLLALLADGATGPARAELAQALGVPAEEAAAEARRLLAVLGEVGGLASALGLWTRLGLPLEERWAAGLPPGTRGTLTGDRDIDRATLDAWAAERTGGLIETMPVSRPEQAMLVLAGALALRLQWRRPFTQRPAVFPTGPWAGRTLLGLHRTSTEPNRLGVALTSAGPITVYQVGGDAGTDVHLVLGTEQAAPGAVLAAAVTVSTGLVPAVPGEHLPEGEPGPGVRIRTVESSAPQPRVAVTTVGFSVRAEHDLLRRAALFGLETACRNASGHFPGISAFPLAVGEARQSAMAEFHAKGFQAAAVTAIAMAPGSAPPRERYRVREAEVRFDRPFGFLAVHRATGLVLAAGWIADPMDYPPPG